ncbi:Swi SNF matrix associated, actin dependent regulator of chromatin [Saguinus oedipus]|uniref:Swi SNF matrix associated, actin dependent regulator of chromatin n=1 Tax=Saguinus oedipus TaxID=9490 RepID=A0ABQ9VJH1_SAGOE|nr:Swi SNF matrix associated, actin dependent regulator of chromatin [Saguinus oedipus]
MLQACTEAVIENKTRYIRIDGSVSSSERIHLVNQFQKDPDTRVAILSIQAAGQGKVIEHTARYSTKLVHAKDQLLAS